MKQLRSKVQKCKMQEPESGQLSGGNELVTIEGNNGNKLKLKAPGRPPGIPNKLNAQVKEALLFAGLNAGDVGLQNNEILKMLHNKITPKQMEVIKLLGGGLPGYFSWVALFHPHVYGQLIGKVLPMQVQVNENRRMVPYRSKEEVLADLLGKGVVLDGELLEDIKLRVARLP